MADINATPGELAEAVEWLKGLRSITASNNAIGRKDYIIDRIDTLLAYVRSGGLTEGQRKVLRDCDWTFNMDGSGSIQTRLRAAFPWLKGE